MLRLYLRFYVVLLASLALFGLTTALVWHLAGGPTDQSGARLARLIQNVLPPVDAAREEQQDALRRLAAGLDGDVTLFSANGAVIASVGRALPLPAARHTQALIYSRWQGGAFSAVRLSDGRLIAASVPIGFANPRLMFHLLLAFLVMAIGVSVFPIFRQFTGRLERLQRGVESLGAGDLAARVAVEGHDEVAQLAASFNRAASQIEVLVRAHQTLLANASHELRTPLARIRLAIELLKSGADAKSKTGLESDIAELDQLVDEILLASRLDVLKVSEFKEEIDLLALAAEESSRYDDVQLDGAPVKIQGDPRLLRRLFRNLLENARRHGVPPTQMRIAGDPTTATVTVWDAGPGPAESEFEQIFLPFYRRRNGGTGSGLGLSLVRQIARSHGGEARCAVLPDGRAGFIITLKT